MGRREAIHDNVESALAIYWAGAAPEITGWELIVFYVRAEIRDATDNEIVDAITSVVQAAVADSDEQAQGTWTELFKRSSPL